jgi:hypothetical protein
VKDIEKVHPRDEARQVGGGNRVKGLGRNPIVDPVESRKNDKLEQGSWKQAKTVLSKDTP